jgi:hypothetical protein
MMQEALDYLRRGYSVIPLRPRSKEPLILWQEFTKRHATESEISAWFASGENNLGIVTGSISGFVVVDVDGEEGLVSSRTIGLKSNTVALTGKGEQYCFQCPTVPLKNAVRILPGIDIRSEGGYICAPPSIHPNGKRYTWLLGPSRTLPNFPQSLLAPKSTGSIPDAKPEGWISEALNNLKEGSRNDTFARVVGKLHHNGLDRVSIWTLLLPHAKACDFSERELNAVIQSITRYETDPTRTGSDVNSASIESFLRDSKPPEWLCEPIIAKESIGFCSGLPETYKTWMLNDLAIECARGNGLWLGLYPVRGGRVLFIDQERSKGETQRRFRSLLGAKALGSSDLRGKLFIRSGTTTRIDIDDSYRAFQKELREIQPSLILIDSFAAFQTGDENDRMTVQKVLERIKEIRSEFHCSIVFIDHETKAAYSDQREGITPNMFRMAGSVGKGAAADFVLTVRRYDPTTCAIYHTKSTLGPRAANFVVHVVDTPEGNVRVYGEAGAK